MRTRTIVSEIRAAACSWEERFKDDADLARSSRADARDLKKVADFVEDGQLQRACNLAGRLDTIVRDQLPQSFFDLLKRRGIPW